MFLLRVFLLLYGLLWLLRLGVRLWRSLDPAARPGRRAPRATGGPAESPEGQRTDARTPYEILGARPGMNDLELRQAYQAAVQQYHPDQVAHLGADLQQLAETRTKEINAAYALVRRLRRGFHKTSN